MQDSVGHIFRRARAFFSGTALSRITGMVRDMLMGWAFGATAPVAALMIGYRFSQLLRRLLGEGVMQSAVIPQLVAARHEGVERANAFYRALTFILTLVLSGIILLAEAGLLLALRSDFLGEETRLICQLTAWMLPGLLFICLAGINGAFLQCEGHYFLSGVASVAFNVVWIVAVLLLAGWSSETAMPWLAMAITFACFAQWLATAPQVYCTVGWPHLASDWRLVRRAWPDLRGLAFGLSAGVVGVSAAQLNGTIDAVFAAYASPEGPALLWFAIRVQQLPLALFGVALSGALLPAFSRAIKQGQLEQARHYLDFALRQGAVLVMPSALVLCVCGVSIVNLLFGRGEFTPQAVSDTAQCLWAYAIGLPATVYVLLLGPGFFALGDYATPARGAVIAVVCNTLLDAILIGAVGMGPVAVAVATSVATCVNAVYLHRHLTQRLGSVLSTSTGVILFKSAIASLVAAGLSLAVMQAIYGESVPLSRAVIDQIAACAISCSLFGGSFLAACWLLHIPVMASELRATDKLPIALE